jgi:hypothetical protein
MKTKKHLIRFPGTVLRKLQSVHVKGFMLLAFFLLQQKIGAVTHSPRDMRPAAEWILDKTVSNVDFYYLISECEGKKVVFLKFINRNNSKVKVSWKEIFSTQFEKNRAGYKGPKQLVLSKGETAQTNCNQVNIKECLVQPSEVSTTYLAEITSFSFSDVQVSTAS